MQEKSLIKYKIHVFGGPAVAGFPHLDSNIDHITPWVKLCVHSYFQVSKTNILSDH